MGVDPLRPEEGGVAHPPCLLTPTVGEMAPVWGEGLWG